MAHPDTRFDVFEKAMDELMPFVTGGANPLHKVKNLLVILYGFGDEANSKIEALRAEVADLRAEVERLRNDSPSS